VVRQLLLDDFSLLSDAELQRRQMPQQTKLVLAALRDTRGAPEPETLWKDWSRFLRGLSVTEEGRATIGKVALYVSRARTLDVDRLAASIKTIEPAAEEIVTSTARPTGSPREGKGKSRWESRGESRTAAQDLEDALSTGSCGAPRAGVGE